MVDLSTAPLTSIGLLEKIIRHNTIELQNQTIENAIENEPRTTPTKYDYKTSTDSMRKSSEINNTFEKSTVKTTQAITTDVTKYNDENFTNITTSTISPKTSNPDKDMSTLTLALFLIILSIVLIMLIFGVLFFLKRHKKYCVNPKGW